MSILRDDPKFATVVIGILVRQLGGTVNIPQEEFDTIAGATFTEEIFTHQDTGHRVLTISVSNSANEVQ